MGIITILLEETKPCLNKNVSKMEVEFLNYLNFVKDNMVIVIIKSRLGGASQLVDTSRCWEDGATERSMAALHPYPYILPMHLFHLALPESYPSFKKKKKDKKMVNA